MPVAVADAGPPATHAPEHDLGDLDYLKQSLESQLPSDAVLEHSRDKFDCCVPHTLSLSIVVFGASGDLAKKKTYPALFALFEQR